MDRHYTWGLAIDAADPDLWYSRPAFGARNAPATRRRAGILYRKRGDAPWKALGGNGSGLERLPVGRGQRRLPLPGLTPSKSQPCRWRAASLSRRSDSASPWRGQFRVETWFCFKADPGDFQLGETDIRALYLTFDVMDLHHVREHGEEPRRWWPALRYHNAENGELVRRWQANIGSEGVKDGAWEYLTDGQQDLGFNRAATKYQWNYLRFTFDPRGANTWTFTVTARSSRCGAAGTTRTRRCRAGAPAPTNVPV